MCMRYAVAFSYLLCTLDTIHSHCAHIGGCVFPSNALFCVCLCRRHCYWIPCLRCLGRAYPRLPSPRKQFLERRSPSTSSPQRKSPLPLQMSHRHRLRARRRPTLLCNKLTQCFIAEFMEWFKIGMMHVLCMFQLWRCMQVAAQ